MKSCNDVTFLEEKEMPVDFDHHYYMIRSRLTESLRCFKHSSYSVEHPYIVEAWTTFLRKSNVLSFQSDLLRFILENNIYKFENNFQIHDVTNR